MWDAVASADSISSTPSMWGKLSSLLSENRRVFPVIRRICPYVHLVSHRPRTAILYRLIPAETCAVFPLSSMVHIGIFHVPMLVINLVERKFWTVASAWLSLRRVTQPLWAPFLSQNMSWWVYSRWSFCSGYSFYRVGLLAPRLTLLHYPGLEPAGNWLYEPTPRPW